MTPGGQFRYYTKLFFSFFYSPNGRKLRSTVELERYLYENPGLQCDRDVTNCVQYKVS